MGEPVLYRKYRPQSFKEVLGQGHAVSVLEASVKLRRIAHAYLFAGSHGTGKTSVARILSRALGVHDEDLYEIDAASNRGIENVRQLREAVNTLPFRSPYKVYIVDEVHMLTREAFSALLKTLEEPPTHVIFILATTEIDRLPETVISRCELYTFKKPSQRILKELVLTVAKREGCAIDTAAADLIALLAERSFRDVHGILQKVITASSDRRISLSEVQKVTGAPRTRVVNDFIAALAARDEVRGLTVINEVLKENVEMRVYLKLILEKLRYILLLRFAPELNRELEADVSPDDFVFLKTLAVQSPSAISPATLLLLLSAYDDVSRRSYLPQLPLELALMRIARQDGGRPAH